MLDLSAMSTYVLGISAFYHDSAAALLVDGRIVAAAQEERFTRKKHDSEFPSRAAAYCLQEGGISASQLDYVGFYDKPGAKFDRLISTLCARAPSSLSVYLRSVPMWLRRKLHLPGEIRRELPGYTGPIL